MSLFIPHFHSAFDKEIDPTLCFNMIFFVKFYIKGFCLRLFWDICYKVLALKADRHRFILIFPLRLEHQQLISNVCSRHSNFCRHIVSITHISGQDFHWYLNMFHYGCNVLQIWWSPSNIITTLQNNLLTVECSNN